MSLPAEIRIMIYKHVLVGRSPIRAATGARDLVPNLLLTNTTIYHEAKSLLYRYNCFDFVDPDCGEIFGLFVKIGATNASRIQYIEIRFPGLKNDDGYVSLIRDCDLILRLIQPRCPNTKCLIVDSLITQIFERAFMPGLCNDPKFFEAMLEVVDAHFRAFPCVQEIIIEVREEQPSSFIQKKMKSLGWIVVLPHTYRGAVEY